MKWHPKHLGLNIFLSVGIAYCAYDLLKAYAYGTVTIRMHGEASYAEDPVLFSVHLILVALGLLMFAAIMYVANSGERIFDRAMTRYRPKFDDPARRRQLEPTDDNR